MLYILNFYLPRFLDLPLREKLTTTLHELWHIGPKFDGDVRRLGGRCFAHGSSQKQYDAHIEALLDRWLALGPPEPLYDFLRLKFRELSARHGRVLAARVPVPTAGAAGLNTSARPRCRQPVLCPSQSFPQWGWPVLTLKSYLALR